MIGKTLTPTASPTDASGLEQILTAACFLFKQNEIFFCDNQRQVELEDTKQVAVTESKRRMIIYNMWAIRLIGRSLLQPGRILLNWYQNDLWNCFNFYICSANSFNRSLYVFSSKINMYSVDMSICKMELEQIRPTSTLTPKTNQEQIPLNSKMHDSGRGMSLLEVIITLISVSYGTTAHLYMHVLSSRIFLSLDLAYGTKPRLTNSISSISS